LNWRRTHLESLQGRRQSTYAHPSALERLVVPDLAVVGWLPFALSRALSLSKRERFDCVLTTSPPVSAHLVGMALRITGTAWIADLRDGWTFDPPRRAWPTRVQSAFDGLLERRVLATATRLIAVTGPIARDLEARLGVPAAVITNGFDPEEEPATSAPPLDPTRHSLVHTGRMNVVGRSPRAFFEGLLEYLQRRPDGAERLEVVLAGPVSTEQEELMADPRLDGLVRSVGSLPRPVALALQRKADTLLVLAEGNEVRPARSVATGKLFEYLGAGRPVLVLGEDSEAARIVSQTRAGLVAPGDAVAVAGALRELVEGCVEFRAEGIERFAWPALAERFEEEIEAAVAGG
jgi:glycosyltransferase involved in cell wall biosynthesis